MGETTLKAALLEPTKIYVKSLLNLLKKVNVHALSHITGGGLTENLPRVLPANTQAIIDGQSWEFPLVFQWLQEKGNVATEEMIRTFNCGIGMVVCVAKEDVEQTLSLLEENGETAFIIGNITESSNTEPGVTLVNF